MKTKVKELLEAIAQKDINALGLLYEEVARQVFNYIRSITLCKETAEDVLHDVFMQIYDNAARISRADEPMAYIMRIARNRAYNIWKGEKRTLTGIEADGVSEDTASHIIAKLEFEEAYDALPQKQRETIYLHLYCGSPTTKFANNPRGSRRYGQMEIPQSAFKIKRIFIGRIVYNL